MPLQQPLNAPLTDTQAELTAKIGSMKSLLSLPFKKQTNIPKSQQISTFDYLLKIMKAIGIQPEPIFRLFIGILFDETTDFLEDKILKGISASLAKKGRDLNSSSIIPPGQLTEEKEKELKESNYQHLKSVSGTIFPANFMTTIKIKLVEELVFMIFGPFDKMGRDTANLTQSDIDRIKGDALCGSNMFTLSNNPIIRNQDLEYNRIQLKEQLEKGSVSFVINCNKVEISLPDDPGFIFNGSNPNPSVPGSTITPAQSFDILVNYVSSNAQQKDNQRSKDSSAKTFWQILLEKIFGYITTLVIPYVGPIFSYLNTNPASSGLSVNDLIYSACAISNDKDNEEKKAFANEFLNELFKALVSIMLKIVIKEFKKLIKNYFARTAQERIKRRIEKQKAKFKLFKKAGDNADKVSRFRTAASSLSSILGQNANSL